MAADRFFTAGDMSMHPRRMLIGAALAAAWLLVLVPLDYVKVD